MMHLLYAFLMVLGIVTAGAFSDTGSRTPSVVFAELFSSIDSISTEISKHAQNPAPSLKQIESAVRDLMDKNRQIQGIVLFDDTGATIGNFNCKRKNSLIGNAASKKWFAAAKAGEVPFFGGVVRVDQKYCFLRSYPFTVATRTINTNGVMAVLIDADGFLDQFRTRVLHPFAVAYKSVPIYHSSAETAGFTAYSVISGCEDLAIAFGTETVPAPLCTNQEVASIRASLPLLLAFIGGTLLLCLLSYLFGRHFQEQANYRMFLEMEYEKISKEQHKQIHDRALSQVYCEIRRQIETHEMKNIEEEVRKKIGLEIEARVMVN